MTRGKWLVLVLLIILAALLTQVFKEKRTRIASELTSSPAEPSISTIPEPTPLTNAGAAVISSEEREQTAARNGQHLQVIVQNEKGQPLAEARVRPKIKGEKSEAALTNFDSDLKTDVNGVADVLWPLEKIKQLELSAAKKDYSTRKMTWDFESGDNIPPSYTIKLKRGFNIGGMVVDPEGNPISEAKVSVSRFWMGSDDSPQKKNEQPAFSSKT